MDQLLSAYSTDDPFLNDSQQFLLQSRRSIADFIQKNRATVGQFKETGTIFGGRALSGYATTDSGRDAVFSIIINGERDATSASLGALDAFVRTILRS